MNYKLLGIIAVLCAPFLYIDFLTSAQHTVTWQTGVCGFLYMTGWLCSIAALQSLKVLGNTKFARIAFIMQYVLLTLAQLWNIWVIVGPSYNNILYRIFDVAWPLSNIWMIVIGITALRANRLKGWKKYVPLIVGLWFPATVVPSLFFGIHFIAGIYSVTAFALLGIVVYTAKREQITEEDEQALEVSDVQFALATT